MPRLTPAAKAAAAAEKLKGLDEFKAEVDEAAPIKEPGTEVEKAPPTSRKTTAKKPAAAEDLFTPLADVTDFLNLLYWGREGSGKTSDALTLANLGRVVVINAEGGLKLKALKNRGINIDNVSVWPKPGEPITYEGLEEVMLKMQSDLMDDPKAWVGLIWDSGTEISAAFTIATSDDRVDKARNRGATVDVFDSFFTDRGDYGTSGRMVRKLLRLGRDLQLHFIVTALERRDVDEDTSKVAYGPAVPPGLQTDLLGYMDLVLHTKEADDERPFFRALAKRAGTARAKDRFDSLPKVLVEPTVERILGYIEDDITEASDPIQEQLTAVLAKPKPQTAAQKRAAAKAAKDPATPPAGKEADSPE